MQRISSFDKEKPGKISSSIHLHPRSSISILDLDSPASTSLRPRFSSLDEPSTSILQPRRAVDFALDPPASASPAFDLDHKLQLHLHHRSQPPEALLEIVGAKNFSGAKNEDLPVSISKKQSDMFFGGSCTLGFLSETGNKQVVGFQCEPKGELILALITNTNISGPAKTINTTSIPLQGLMDPNSKLSVEKWFELKPNSGNLDSKPVSLHVAASFTVPFLGPQVIHMFKSNPICMNTCYFPLPGKAQQIQRWASFVDDNGNDIINLQIRIVKKKKGMGDGISKSIVGVTKQPRKSHLLAECTESACHLRTIISPSILRRKIKKVVILYGILQIKLFPGKKLGYEPKNCHHIELGFITAVEFSIDHPYGRAVAC